MELINIENDLQIICNIFKLGKLETYKISDKELANYTTVTFNTTKEKRLKYQILNK